MYKKGRNYRNLHLRNMFWLLGKNLQLSLNNKLLLYKMILKPVWTFGVQIWGCTKRSNRDVIQRFQNKVSSIITNAPSYLRNMQLHYDLNVPPVHTVIGITAERHEEWLQSHTKIQKQ